MGSSGSKNEATNISTAYNNQSNINSNEISLKEEELKKRLLVLSDKENEIKKREEEIESKLNLIEKEKKLNEEKMKRLEQENKEIKKKYLEIKKDPIVVGLDNISATGYMNATLQSLSNTDELTNYFLNEYKYEPNNRQKIISNAYYNAIKNLWNRENNNKTISPTEFKEILSKENPLFKGTKPNDSKDLIHFLIERMHNELNVVRNDNNNNSISQNENQLDEQNMLNIFKNDYKIKYNSIISNSFYGIFETKSQCQKCKNIKYNFQAFTNIEFPLERVNQYCFANGKRINYNMNKDKNPDIDLYECFEYYCSINLMNGDNQMYCNICKSNHDSLYCSLLYSTPDYLIINLSRGKNAEYECNVIYPEQLNLFNFVSNKNGNTIYELYAVICHIGPSNKHGHFAAYCRNRIDKKWYLYNDGFVTLCQNLKDYQKGMVYILFYQTLKNYN